MIPDKLGRDYGVGQVRHNGRHFYCTGEHWLFSRLDRGLSVDEARRDHEDAWGFDMVTGEPVGEKMDQEALAKARREHAKGVHVRILEGGASVRASLGWLYRRYKHGGDDA